MPEMPEVEAVARFLRTRCTSKVVARTELVAFPCLKTAGVPLAGLAGLAVEDVRAYGKFLGLGIGGLWLVIHFAHVGWLAWRDAMPAAPARPGRGPLALRVVLDDGTGFDLTEAGTRKNLALYVVGDPREVPGIAGLGPDPLGDEFTAGYFGALLDRAGGTHVKSLLTDQRAIAGVGNAYSDEILWAASLSPDPPIHRCCASPEGHVRGVSDARQASSLPSRHSTCPRTPLMPLATRAIGGSGLSPFAACGRLDEVRRQALYTAIRGVLSTAVDQLSGLPPGEIKDAKHRSYNVHARTGLPCPACGTTIAEVSYADSSLQYCPGCQTGGKPLADRRMSRLLK